jgi:hypothetical protein
VKPLDEISEEKSMAFDDEAAPTATVGPMPGPPTQLQRYMEASAKVATPVRVLRTLQVRCILIWGGGVTNRYFHRLAARPPFSQHPSLVAAYMLHAQCAHGGSTWASSWCGSCSCMAACCRQ